MKYVFADMKVGARTWKTGTRVNPEQSPTCIIPALLRTVAYAEGNFIHSSGSNVFTSSIAGANTRADLYFGLSQRVRSVSFTVEGSGKGASSAANNRIRVSLWPLNYGDNTSYTVANTPAFPADQLLMRVSLTSANYALTTATATNTVNLSFNAGDNYMGELPNYGCGWGVHLEARIGGSSGSSANWTVTMTPSESKI